MLHVNQVKFSPLVLPPKLQAHMQLLGLCSYYFWTHGPDTVSQPALAEKTTSPSSWKLRSNKCVICNKAEFVIIQAKLQQPLSLKSEMSEGKGL